MKADITLSYTLQEVDKCLRNSQISLNQGSHSYHWSQDKSVNSCFSSFWLPVTYDLEHISSGLHGGALSYPLSLMKSDKLTPPPHLFYSCFVCSDTKQKAKTTETNGKIVRYMYISASLNLWPRDESWNTQQELPQSAQDQSHLAFVVVQG